MFDIQFGVQNINLPSNLSKLRSFITVQMLLLQINIILLTWEGLKKEKERKKNTQYLASRTSRGQVHKCCANLPPMFKHRSGHQSPSRNEWAILIFLLCGARCTSTTTGLLPSQYLWVERSNWSKCLTQEHNKSTITGLEPTASFL